MQLTHHSVSAGTCTGLLVKIGRHTREGHAGSQASGMVTGEERIGCCSRGGLAAVMVAGWQFFARLPHASLKNAGFDPIHVPPAGVEPLLLLRWPAGPQQVQRSPGSGGGAAAGAAPASVVQC